MIFSELENEVEGFYQSKTEQARLIDEKVMPMNETKPVAPATLPINTPANAN